MTGRFRFDPAELGPTELNELDDAMDAVRAIELAAGDATVSTGPAFSDRVMAAIAHEPSPAPVGFLAPLRRTGLLGGFGESLRQAWATLGTGRPPFARAAALAYVLLVAAAGVSVVGAASFGAANALGIIPPSSTVAPTDEQTEEPEATVAPDLETDEPSAEPSESAEPPEASPDASEGPDDPGGEPEATDHHGGDSGSGGGGDDRSGPSSTEQPDASDDHGGSGSDDGSGSGGSGTDGSSESGSD